MTLKNARLNKNLSQGDLSKLTGISVRTLQHYEQEQRDINGANLKTLLTLSNALNCKLIDILTDDELIKLLSTANIK